MKSSRKNRGRAYGAKVRAASSAHGEMQNWMLRASRGGQHPCVQVVKCNDGDMIVRAGLDTLEERPCPLCQALGVESTLFVERVQAGFIGAGMTLGHCDRCYSRGVKMREIGFWETEQ